MTNLTKAQGIQLQRALVATYRDDSGPGAVIHDGVQKRIFERLFAMGLVRMGHARGGFHLGSASVTPAGRELAEKHKPKIQKAMIAAGYSSSQRCEFGHDDPWNSDNL